MKTKLRRDCAAVARTALTLGLSGCGSELGSSATRSGGGTIASQMIFGGPPEFKTRPDGIPGLKKNYGVEFGKYTVTDTGGPVTVNALKRGQVDAADLFTTDPSIEANDFVDPRGPEVQLRGAERRADHQQGQGDRRRQADPQRRSRPS